MDLTRYADPAAFASRAQPFLLRHEAEHNLILGLVGALQRQSVSPAAPPAPPYLAILEEGGEVLAVALRTPYHRLVLSRISPGVGPPAGPPDAPPEGVDRVAEEALEQLVADLAGHIPDLSGVLGPPALAEAFARRWVERRGRRARRGMATRIFQLDAVTPPPAVAGALRPATEADLDLLVSWVAAFTRDIGEREARDEARARAGVSRTIAAGGLHLWEVEGAGPVSMANATGATPNGIRINLVYTPPELRRRGYASACVGALSQAMLDAGRRFCFLYTDLANPTSNHIYQELGYRPVADADTYDFEA
jgi:GNAT superfamily N-acetyltransferase